LARAPSARQRKLVEDGAKGVADRWLGDSAQAAQDGVRMRSAVKRFSGKPVDHDATAEPAPAADPQNRARKRSTRAEQAATGMMAQPPGTFDETAIKDWLAKMPAEDLAKLARLTAIAKAGKKEERSAWRKVDNGIVQRGVHLEVHGGTVNIDNSSSADRQSEARKSDGLGRHFSRWKDFING